MDVGFCPKCHKAGLHYYDNNNVHSSQRLPPYDKERWCPRCQCWVEPHYINVMKRER